MIKKLALFAIAGLLVLCVVAAGLYWSWAHIASDVKTFAPDGRADLDAHTELMTFPDRDVLLIRRARPGDDPQGSPADSTTVPDAYRSARYYRYDPETDDVEPTDADTWDLSAGRVTVCGEDYTPIKECDGEWVPGGPTWLMIGGSKLPIAAAGPGRSAVSPTGELLVVVSGDPDEQLGLMGQLVRGSQRQHYHQVVSLKEEVCVGKPLRIPMVSRLAGRRARPGRDRLVDICWSADERYVVYVGRTSLCVVPVERDEND